VFHGSKYFISVSQDRLGKVWSTTGARIQTLNAHKDNISSLALSPSGNTLLTGSWDRSVCFWKKSKSGSLTYILEGTRNYPHFINAVAFSPTGKQFILGLPDHTVNPLKISLLLSKVTRCGFLITTRINKDRPQHHDLPVNSTQKW